MSKIAIIGYCQTVALLNAIGSWRQSLRQDLTTENPNIDAPFGWENVNTKGRLFDITSTDEFREFCGAKFCLLNSETHPAAHFKKNEAGDLSIDCTAALRQFLVNAADFDVIVSVINGSELGRATYLPDFDIFPYEDIDAERPPIDGLYVDQWTRQSVSWVEACLYVMRHFEPHKKIIHVAPPPPLLIMGNNGKYTPLRSSIRIKIHRENMKMMRQITSNLGIDFIEERLEAFTTDGFLMPEFDDGHGRGNVEFGRLTAKKIIELI